MAVYTYRDLARVVSFTLSADASVVVSIEESEDKGNRHVMSAQIDADALRELLVVATPILKRVDDDQRESERAAREEAERFARSQRDRLFGIGISQNPPTHTVHLFSCVHTKDSLLRMSAQEVFDNLARQGRRELLKLCRHCQPAGSATKGLDSRLRLRNESLPDLLVNVADALMAREKELLKAHPENARR